MWSNLLSSGEAAKERFTTALKETNDAMSQRASEHAHQIKMMSQNYNSTDPNDNADNGVQSAPSTTKEINMTGANTPKDQSKDDDSKKNPIFSFTSGFTGIGTNKKSISSSEKTSIFNQGEIFDSLKSGWGNVVEATKNVVETTRDVVEKEQTRIQATLFANGPYTRDISLPLDSESLRDAEVVYLTNRLITMSHPAMQSPTNGDITPHRKLAAISHLLHKRHGGKFMIWNLSELEYDYSVLQDQVMTFQFPGSPSPPLGMIFKILLSVESWLKADERNVAVMHCLTGRGRTSTVMAAFLCWMGEAGFDDDPNTALEYIAHCKRISPDVLTIPSQRRYVNYFKNMMDGVRPNQPPILLKRIIMSEAPKFGRNKQTINDDEAVDANETEGYGELGCSPYLQVFKAGKLVFTTAASKSYNQSKDDLPFCVPSDGSLTFAVETVVQGDILIRCRHLTHKGQRVSMFRAAFHTGYTPAKVLRLSKAQLDGACNDKRYADDFYIDLIFEECSAAMASKHLLSSVEQDSESDKHVRLAQQNTIETDDNIQNEAALRRMGGTIAGSTYCDGMTITASAYDSMVHRDSRFWDVIAERRKKIASGSFDAETTDDTGPFYGPTIGRRREFASEMKSTKSSANESFHSCDLGSHRSIQSFSIGGELDFTGDESRHFEKENIEFASPKEKKDDLMEALMAIDDDLDEDQNDDSHSNQDGKETEEIVFDVNLESTEENRSTVNMKIVKETESSEIKSKNVNDEEETISKSKQSSCDTSIVKIDDLDLDVGDSDQFDFDDDDELQDLEDFLTKAKP